ncbi:MAG TPA: helix-turn-helix transcriptional regulator [Ktedonobacterales bacterium]|jgi:transcriptional regulator with XRE-family HTH domain|nr:helix-turn-helix transcriptional regulator [Ktedonobacterales bacterium]
MASDRGAFLQEERDNTDDWTRDWGRLLRTARQVAGLSLTDLSVRTGLSKGYLSKLESGQDGARNPSRATLVALARALPSFRPLAYQLEPAEMGGPPSLAFAEQAPRPPQLLIGAESENDVEPIQLGWREMELLVALLALERSAIPAPLSAIIIARAVDRSADSVIPALERLTRSGVLRCYPPTRPGGAPTYGRGTAFDTRVGLSRLGDALVLAAALLAQSPSLPRRRNDDGSW